MPLDDHRILWQTFDHLDPTWHLFRSPDASHVSKNASTDFTDFTDSEARGGRRPRQRGRSRFRESSQKGTGPSLENGLDLVARRLASQAPAGPTYWEARRLMRSNLWNLRNLWMNFDLYRDSRAVHSSGASTYDESSSFVEAQPRSFNVRTISVRRISIARATPACPAAPRP